MTLRTLIVVIKTQVIGALNNIGIDSYTLTMLVDYVSGLDSRVVFYIVMRISTFSVKN
ncbi:MAG: hypothetical protein ACTHWZ_02055 [Peptoniphilaceae bacterium]